MVVDLVVVGHEQQALAADTVKQGCDKCDAGRLACLQESERLITCDATRTQAAIQSCRPRDNPRNCGMSFSDIASACMS